MPAVYTYPGLSGLKCEVLFSQPSFRSCAPDTNMRFERRVVVELRQIVALTYSTFHNLVTLPTSHFAGKPFLSRITVIIIAEFSRLGNH